MKATTRTAITRLHPRQSERVFNSGGARKGGKRCLQRVAISNPQIGKAHSAISTGGVFLVFSRFIGQAFPRQRGRREVARSVMGHSSRLSQANSLSWQSTMRSRVALKQVKHDPAGRGDGLLSRMLQGVLRLSLNPCNLPLDMLPPLVSRRVFGEEPSRLIMW